MRPILRIDLQLCQTCTTCQARAICKTRAIVQYERGDLPAVDSSRCRGCMVCIPACPFGAVQKANVVTPGQATHPTHRDTDSPAKDGD